MHILPNISQSKDNQTMKLGQLIEYNMKHEIFFFRNHAENEAGRLVPVIFSFLKKSFKWGKSKWSAA